jgi:chemotaxis protein MotB
LGDAEEQRLPGIADAARLATQGAEGPTDKAANAGKAQADVRQPSAAAQKDAAAGSQPDAPAAAGEKTLDRAAAEVLRDVQQAAKPIAGSGGPGIEVTIEGNGIVLSLTDTSTFGMFAIGSSDPSQQTIDLIARIAPVLTANSKRIVVRGHTDSRAYRTDRNNNWRLSMTRAEAAYAMLVRAGVDERRFTRIEGYADRKLKVPGDSEAAANRRIEILLQQVDE